MVVELEVPNYDAKESEDADGLRELRPNNLDFDITTTGNNIKVDSNSERYITNLRIKVPRESNLVLDSYRDGKLQVSDVHGHLNVRSFHNHLTLTECSGSAKLWTYHGDLVVGLTAISADSRLEFESYNGSIDLALPADIHVNTQLRTNFGKLLTDFDIAEVGDPVQSEIRKDGSAKIEFDKFVRGTINGGGQVLSVETEHGDIRLRKHKMEPTVAMQLLMKELNPEKNSTDSRAHEGDELEAREKTYQDIKAFVELDQMPKYLMHAAHAGLLELQREQAIKQLEIKKAYKIEAELLLDYEKAIQSYEAMMDNPSWRKRFPAMDLKDTTPYRRRLEFLKAEFAKRLKPDPVETDHGDIKIRKKETLEHGKQGLGEKLGREWNDKLGRKLGDELNKELGPELGREWNEKLGAKLGQEWSGRLNRKSNGDQESDKK